MKVIAVVVARLNSSRLPGKHLRLLANKPHLEHVYQRLRHAACFDEIVLATIDKPDNVPLMNWCQAHRQPYYAHIGHEDNVLERVDQVVTSHKPDIIVTVCGDCPLIEPVIIQRMVNAAKVQPQADVVRFHGYPDYVSIHEGFDCYTRVGWQKLMALSVTDASREHVGSALKSAENVNHIFIDDDPIYRQVAHRISIDTLSDYQFMNEIYERWYRSHGDDTIVSLAWVIEQLQDDKTLKSMNEHVQQKSVSASYQTILLVVLNPDDKVMPLVSQYVQYQQEVHSAECVVCVDSTAAAKQLTTPAEVVVADAQQSIVDIADKVITSRNISRVMLVSEQSTSIIHDALLQLESDLTGDVMELNAEVIARELNQA